MFKVIRKLRIDVSQSLHCLRYPSQEDSRSRSGHGAKRCIQERLRCWYCRARRACRGRPCVDDRPDDAELIRDLLFLERPRATRQRSVPVRSRKEGCRGSVVGDISGDRVVGCGTCEGGDLGCDG